MAQGGNPSLGPTMDNTVPDSTDGSSVQYAPMYAKGGEVGNDIPANVRMSSPLGPGRNNGFFNILREIGIPDDVASKATSAVYAQQAPKMAAGGSAHFDGGGGVDEAKLIAEIVGRMAKDQAKSEVESLKKPRSATDIVNKGVVAPMLGAPVDIANMGLSAVDMLREKASGKPVENRFASEKPFLGSEYLKDLMNQYGLTTAEERPMMETALSFLSPAAGLKGAAKAGTSALKMLKKAP